MSHTTTVKLEVKDLEAFKSACESCQDVKDWSIEKKSHRLFDGTNVDGIFVWFKDWKYPVVFTEKGEAKYDNYNGSWGNQKCLDGFMQHYAGGAFLTAALAEGHSHVSTTSEGDNLIVTTTRDGFQVQATIPANGDPKVEVIGCSGSSCENLTAALTGALGSTKDINHKQEYFDREREQQREAQ